MVIVYSLLAIVVSCYWIYLACDRFELGANFLGRNMAAGVKGATINAIGSSAPELITTLIFLFVVEGTGIAEGVATTAGSAMFNMALIPALCILVTAYKLGTADFVLNKKVVIRDGIALLTVEGLLIYLLGSGTIEMWHGVTFLLAYAVYITFTLNVDLGADEEDDDEEDFGDMSTVKALGWLSCAILELSAACYIMCEAVVHIAGAAGILPFFVAVILAAAATSVPDLLISMKDAEKGNADDAVSNAVGSNIFDVAVCFGLPVVIYCAAHGPVVISAPGTVAALRYLLFGISTVIIGLLLTGKTVGKKAAYAMVALYVAFASYTIISAFV